LRRARDLVIQAGFAPSEAQKPAKPGKPQAQAESPTIVPGVPGITPTSAFNLAYNDYLNGKYELAVAGFQRFIKDFPGTSLTPNAHYWLGESYYNQKDYTRAIRPLNIWLRNIRGMRRCRLRCISSASRRRKRAIWSNHGNTSACAGRVSASDEAKLAKNKLAELR